MPDGNIEKLAAGLHKIGLVLRHQAWERGGETGLTPTQSQVLALLSARSESGLRVTTIASELALKQPTVTDAVNTLVGKKLVTKCKAADDARAVLVRLSAAGRRAAATASQWPDVILHAVGTLDESEQAVFFRVLIKIIRDLQQRGEIPIGRMCTSCVHFRPHAHAGSPKAHHCAYIDSPIGDIDLRLDCGEHVPVPADSGPRLWELFVNGERLA
ncbi:MAG: MarR family transcriptional regulator [Phycisphaerales bacterium]|nr:MarR family transcriptional regulator [Phycisphaerales bacterium]